MDPKQPSHALRPRAADAVCRCGRPRSQHADAYADSPRGRLTIPYAGPCQDTGCPQFRFHHFGPRTPTTGDQS